MAICYEQLVYFGHALEIALYRVLDEVESSEADKRSTLQAAPTDKAELPESSRTSVPSHALTSAIEFLDYFPQSLDVVVGCARKIEMDRWPELFAIAGDPHDLFEVSRPCKFAGSAVSSAACSQLCIGKKLLKTAASYLLVMHTKHPNENALKVRRDVSFQCPPLTRHRRTQSAFSTSRSHSLTQSWLKTCSGSFGALTPRATRCPKHCSRLACRERSSGDVIYHYNVMSLGSTLILHSRETRPPSCTSVPTPSRMRMCVQPISCSVNVVRAR